VIVCKEFFRVSGVLKVHLRSFMWEWPLEYDVCKKSFHLSDTLKLYLRIHTRK